MLKRFLTGIVIVLLTIGFLALRFVSPYFFDIFILAISVFGTLEVCNVYEKSQKQNDKFFIISYPFAVLITLSISLHYKLSALIYFSIIILEALVYILAMYIKNLTTKKTLNREMIESSYSGSLKQYISNKLSLDCFLLFYPAFLLCLMFFLNHIEGFLLAGDGNVLVGLLLLLMLFATTMFTDTGAYLIGSGLKGKKLCPKISPNKTISGAIGGLICGVFAGLLVYCILNFIPSFAEIFIQYNLKFWMFLVYGFVASLVSQLGDIFASLIKRKNNVKDYGHIFPGHGGFMDRVDGISFNLVITTMFALFLLL